MNKEKITETLKELYTISGFRVSLHNTNFEEIAAYPEAKQAFCAYLHSVSKNEYALCCDCDKRACEQVIETGKPTIYKCHNNLVEAVSPLYNFGALTGFLMMGQVRVEGEEIDPMLLTLSKLGKKGIEARTICDGIPTVKQSMIQSYVKIMTICASYLTLSNAVTGAKATVGQLAMRYISENYTERITIKDICDSIGYSKSTVLSSFKKEFSTTINAYLTNMRLERAKKMLENEDVTINEVALECGFSDQSYFSKVFSAKYKITPTDYRRDEKR